MVLLIRADASAEIGAGHVMRCLALAQGWQDAGGQTLFTINPEAAALEPRLKSEGMDVLRMPGPLGGVADAKQTAAVARENAAAWVVVDGYSFGAEYQRIIKDAGFRLLFVDDNGHAGHYWADLVLNQNMHADKGNYTNREAHTQLLLGTPYVLLRREFLGWKRWKRPIPDAARKVLVTLGGGDPQNTTLKIIEAFERFGPPDVEARIVVGPANRHLEVLSEAARNSAERLQLLGAALNMPELMAWADLAVSAAGSTALEMAFMGLPSILLVLAKNQRSIAEELTGAGAALSLGWHEQVSPHAVSRALEQLRSELQTRSEMSGRGRAIVDGEGVERVLMHLTGVELRLRQVQKDDCQLLWEWANDPNTRAVSFSREPIPWENHVQWLDSRLHDGNCLFYIAVNGEDLPVGQVRFDVDQQIAVISVSVDPRFRGKGYGSTIIRLASRRMLESSGVGTIHAYVKEGNEASIRAFAKGGFSKLRTAIVRDQPAIHFVLRKNDLPPVERAY